MNYRHAFHAGNHADVLKHLVLLIALDRMLLKPTPLAVLDAFAGAGLYALDGAEAQRSPEWRDGVGRLADWPDPPAPLDHLKKSLNSQRYPGSPRLILDWLRPQDRLIACDLHPEEARKLRGEIGADPRAHIHERDGFEALTALLPAPEKRGLILLDPPYEKPDELARSAMALKTGVGRFRQGVFAWWRPIKAGFDLDQADRALIAHTGLEALRVDLAIADPAATTRLVASSMLLLNPPFGVKESVLALAPALSARLDQGGGGWRVTPITG
jgi:23S rRNA (adenine2030-N6)-methyltransferase